MSERDQPMKFPDKRAHAKTARLRYRLHPEEIKEQPSNAQKPFVYVTVYVGRCI